MNAWTRGKETKARLKGSQGRPDFRDHLEWDSHCYSPKESPPFSVEAIAFEEDTFLVMSADPTVRDPKIPLIRIMTDLIETRPRVPGTVLVQGDSPVRLLAIIHDFNDDPSWKEEWIEKAFQGIFEVAERLRLRSLALPLIGTVYGSLEKKRSVQLLTQSLIQRPLNDLLFLWLVVPTGQTREITSLLNRSLLGPTALS